jgi:hypothetical protein
MLNVREVCASDEVGGDLQVFVDEVGPQLVVGTDSTDARGGNEDVPWLVRSKEIVNRALIEEIKLGARADKQPMAAMGL